MGSSEERVRSVQREEVDDVLAAFWEWLRAQEARWREDADREQFHLSPSIAAGEPLLDKYRSKTTVRRLSVGRRVFRTFVRGLIVTVMVGTALAWQFGDGDTKDTVRGWGNSLSGLQVDFRNNSPPRSDVAAEPSPKAPDEAPPQDAAQSQAISANNQSTQMSLATGWPTELQHRFEVLSNDVAVLQRVVEKLMARQELIVQDIAKLQAIEQQRLSTLPRSNQVPPRKNVQSLPVH
jgi:hypothetical protein